MKIPVYFPRLPLCSFLFATAHLINSQTKYGYSRCGEVFRFEIKILTRRSMETKSNKLWPCALSLDILVRFLIFRGLCFRPHKISLVVRHGRTVSAAVIGIASRGNFLRRRHRPWSPPWPICIDDYAKMSAEMLGPVI